MHEAKMQVTKLIEFNSGIEYYGINKKIQKTVQFW